MHLMYLVERSCKKITLNLNTSGKLHKCNTILKVYLLVLLVDLNYNLTFSIDFQIGVHNHLTYSGLSKQVVFMPYYVIINNSSHAIECQEHDRPADPWILIETKTCSPLWPRSEQEDKLLRLRIKDSKEISAPFLYTESHTTLLKLKNKVWYCIQTKPTNFIKINFYAVWRHQCRYSNV